MAIEPVPFRVPLPGRDAFTLDGIRSESHRVLGLLHFADDTLTFEWSRVRRIQQVSLTAVRDDDESTTPALLDVPGAWIAEARLTGGWWAPRLRLRARRLDAFDGLPGAGPGTVVLRVARRDRGIAAAMVETLTANDRLGSGGASASALLPRGEGADTGDPER